MCGIVGYFDPTQHGNKDLISRMNDSILHRGPDDGGIWVQGSIALGNRRLSILDLSAAGHQPMVFPERDLHIVYNGEVYNFLDLRQQLEVLGFTFFSDCDTEVILKGYAAWGTGVFEKLRGMFAIAIWDGQSRTLVLARDRFGIKPLYYMQRNGCLTFASELKALKLHPRFPTETNINALALFLSHLYVPEPMSIYEGIQRLPAGNFAVFDGSYIRQESFVKPPVQSPRSQDYAANAKNLVQVLKDSVAAHLVSDVPIGVLLSGGVDSSVLVALMRMLGQEKILTFSIGFEAENHAYDERSFARQIAARFQTTHQEIVVRPNIFEQVQERLIDIFDEPFANPAALIFDSLSERVSAEVKVALTGIGGDELFGGYPRYLGMQWLYLMGYIPSTAYRLVGSALSRLPSSPDKRYPLDRARRYAKALSQPAHKRYDFVCSYATPDICHALLKPELAAALGDSAYLPWPVSGARDALDQAIETDIRTYLPGDLLTYADRASMYHSLEIRVPFVDSRVLDFARTIPSIHKIHRGELKSLLKYAFRSYLPDEILYRKKQGFSLPIGEWLKGPIRPLIRDLLSETFITQRTCLDWKAVSRVIRDFESGHYQMGFLVWAMMVYCLWQRKQ